MRIVIQWTSMLLEKEGEVELYSDGYNQMIRIIDSTSHSIV
jgi:hypothetical protein